MCGVVYKIRDWDKFFENNKSRIIDQCSFVCMPNKQDGMGLTRIISLKNGASIYGVWCLIVGACSRQRKPRQGYLTDDGTVEGLPWDAKDLANRWRQPVELIEEALRVLSSDRIGWLELGVHEVPSKCRPSAVEQATNERTNERTERMKEEFAAASPPPDATDEESTQATAERKAAKQPTKPTAPVKARHPRAESNADHPRLIAHFRAAWERRWRVEFVMNGGKDGKHFATILERAKSLQRACEIVDAYLADDSSFVTEKFHPIGLLVSQFTTYAAKSATQKVKPTNQRKPGEKVVNWA